MKRIDHIMNITLGNATEPRDAVSSKRKTTAILQRAELQIVPECLTDVDSAENIEAKRILPASNAAPSSSSVASDCASVFVETLHPQSFRNADQALNNAEKIIPDKDAPADTLCLPSTPADASKGKHCCDSPAPPSSLTPARQIRNCLNSPAAFLTFPSTPVDENSPAAPSFSPLTPAQKRNDCFGSPAGSLQFPSTPVGKDCPESPIADLPLTNTLQISSVENSPLPAMSPSTLELYNTLTETVNLEDFQTTDSPLSAEVTVTDPRKKSCRIEETPSSPRDFSPDTSTDYVPDSDETDELETNEQERTSRRRRLTVTAMVHNNFNDSSSGIDGPQANSSAPISHQIDDGLNNTNLNEQQQKGRCKKGRKRRNADYTLAERKKRKYANLAYHTKTKTIEPKVFKDTECKCKKKCSQIIPSEKRKEEFEKYVSLKSYEAQLLFIINKVTEVKKKRSYTVQNGRKAKPKTYHRIYMINNQKVCKDMFLSTFQITNQKVSTCLNKHRAKSYNDQRGILQGGWNKTPQEDIEFIKDIIYTLPKYESHYKRDKNAGVKYLQTGMTVRKIYELYVEKLKEVYGPEKKCVSLATLKTVFYRHFNLRCKVLKADTCSRCDVFANKLHDARTAEEKETITKERDEHQQRAEDLRMAMNTDLQRAKTDDKFECLTFDLEKTLPLPRIATSVIFYKRQLWLYNSGIHAGSNDSGHCYVWIEGEAGRGAQEVGSCLMKYIKTKLNEKVEHLVLWSDCCGGQNRNIKIILMLKALLGAHAHLKTITLKYLESGHTWLPNDTDFSKIEMQLKYYDRIYTADDYINVIKSCKKTKPLTVYQMQKEDFVGISKVEKKITNRKIFVSKEKVNWLKTKEILLVKEKQHSLFMRYSLTDEFKELNIEKKIRGQVQDIIETDLTVLWPEGKDIAQAKLDDLRSLYDLIPMDCRKFYDSLKGNNLITDDVDGFGGEPDFEMEED